MAWRKSTRTVNAPQGTAFALECPKKNSPICTALLCNKLNTCSLSARNSLMHLSLELKATVRQNAYQYGASPLPTPKAQSGGCKSQSNRSMRSTRACSPAREADTSRALRLVEIYMHSFTRKCMTKRKGLPNVWYTPRQVLPLVCLA